MPRYLAIDWDQNQLHVISAEVRGSAIQIRRAVLTAEEQVPNPANAEEMGKHLAERLKAAGISGAPVLACVGRDRLIVKEVRYPKVPDVEEPAVVRFQTAKELTDAVEDVVIDYLPTFNPPEGEQRALALVVRREILQTYKTMCEAAGLKLAALTPRVLGTAACLRKVIGTTVMTPPPEPVDGAVCVVVVADKQAELAVLRGRIPQLTRSMPVASNLAAEIRRNLSVHAGQSPQHPIRAVYVTGKGMADLRERLSELTDIPVHTFDPFANSEAPDLPTGNRGSFAGAMGLIQARADGEVPVNFVSPRQPKADPNPNYRFIRLAVVASVALFVGLVVLGRVLHASWSDDLVQIEAQKADIEAKLVQTTENAKRLKLIDDWDSPVWLDELYELNARIPDVNTLRVTSIATEIVPRSAKTKAAAKATIKGTLLDRGKREPLDQLVARFSKDGYYSPEAPDVQDGKFTLVVYIERRGPTDYQYILDRPEEKKTSKSDKSGKSGTKDKTGKTDETAKTKDAGKTKGNTKGKTKTKSSEPESNE